MSCPIRKYHSNESRVQHSTTTSGARPVAEDGAAALQVFDPETFDIVFTDLGMPGISGWQVARQVKRAAPDLPVVMITGWGAQLEPEQIAESGIDQVLTKPFQWLRGAAQ